MKILYTTTHSVSIELQSINPYYHNEYDVYLNDEFIKKDNKNIFSLFNLNPNTLYKLRVNNNELIFKTKYESVLLDVKRFNAKGDGLTNDTAFIQAAISACPNNGTVYIPKGIYLITSLYLKSNITLYLDKDAKLISNINRLDYPIHPGDYLGIWEGIEQDNFASTLNLINVSNVDIIGEGIVDGRAELSDWYINHRIKNIAWRGHLFYSYKSDNINIIGTTFTHSMSWTIHPYMSNDINIINIKIINDKNMPTTDGIDPDCSKNITIKGSYISVGDDSIVLKSGSYDLAKKYKIPTENILIENNLIENGHGGVVFGSELSGGIKNITVKNCIFKNGDRGLRIKTRRGRGHIGIIDNINFDNIIMENIKTPFVINMYYNMGNAGGHEEYVWTKSKLPFNDLTPVLGKFLFKNMNCNNVSYAGGVFLGLPESKIKEIKIQNVVFNYDTDSKPGIPVMIEHKKEMNRVGIYILNVENLILDNVKFNGNIGNDILEEE